jgi:hypothetical protein
MEPLFRRYADAAIALAQHVVARFRARAFTEHLSSDLVATFTRAERRVRDAPHLAFDAHVFQTELPRIYAARSACNVLLQGTSAFSSTWWNEVFRLVGTFDFVSGELIKWIHEDVWYDASPAHRRLIYRHIFTTDAVQTPIDADYETLSAFNAQMLHRYLDALQFAERLGDLHKHEELARSVRLWMGEVRFPLLMSDLTASASTVPLNECLPPDLAPIAGGTPLQKLRRVCALANADPANGGPISIELRRELRAALWRLEERLEPLAPDCAGAVMLAAQRRPEGGTHNLVAALDPDLLRRMVGDLMLRDT